MPDQTLIHYDLRVIPICGVDYCDKRAVAILTRMTSKFVSIRTDRLDSGFTGDFRCLTCL